MIYEVNKILKDVCGPIDLKTRNLIIFEVISYYNRIVKYPKSLSFGSYIKMVDDLTLEYKSFRQLVISVASCFVLLKHYK